MTLDELHRDWGVVQIDFAKAPPMGMCFAAGFAHGFEGKPAVDFSSASLAGQEAYKRGLRDGRLVAAGEMVVPDYVVMPTTRT